MAVVGLSCTDEISGPDPDLFAYLSSGWEHTCGVMGDGVLYCWGRNAQFQLGNTMNNARDSFPVAATTVARFIQVDAAETHSCAITGAGEAYCWGLGYDGQLGAGGINVGNAPVAVTTTQRFMRIVTGQTHSCGLNQDSVAYCWGLNDFGQLGLDTNVVRTPVLTAGAIPWRDISAGTSHTCAITVGGTAACWGSNAFGQAGTGDTTSNGAYLTPAPIASNENFARIAAGHAHSCGVTTGGVALCWGSNQLGMLGDGTMADSRTPVPVAGNHRFAQISVGSNQSCALTATGQLFCWGNNNTFGGVATDSCPVTGGGTIPCSLSPIPAAPGYSFGAIEVGAFHTCGVLIGGGIMCWGANEEGQVGNGQVGTAVTMPTRVADP